LPRTLAAVSHCVAALIRGDDIDDTAVAPGAELIRRHGLAAMAYARGAKGFRVDYVSNLFAAEKRAAVVREAHAALADRGIEVALLKGISYVGDLYPDAGVRPMGDVDLLIRSGDMPRALECLARLGYRDGTPHGSTAIHHAAQLFRADGGAIDLHRNIEQPWRSRIDLQAVWARTSVGADGMRRLETIDQLLFHLAHLSRTQLSVPLMNYVDTALLRERLDGRALVELGRRAHAYRLERGCRAALAMTDALGARAGRPVLPAWGRLLPGCAEVLAGGLPPRPVQLARKAVLNDEWSQLAGLGAVFVARRGLGWWKRRRPQ